MLRRWSIRCTIRHSHLSIYHIWTIASKNTVISGTLRSRGALFLSHEGPHDQVIVPKHLREIDTVVHSLIDYYEKTHPAVRIIVRRHVDGVFGRWHLSTSLRFCLSMAYLQWSALSQSIDFFEAQVIWRYFIYWSYFMTHQLLWCRFGERTVAKRLTTARRLRSLLLSTKLHISISKIQSEISKQSENSYEMEHLILWVNGDVINVGCEDCWCGTCSRCSTTEQLLLWQKESCCKPRR